MPIKEVFVEDIGAVTISRNRQAVRFKISVRPDGKIRVTIPWLASFKSGEQFLKEHIKWITETKEKLAKKPRVSKLIQPGHLFTTRNFEYHVCAAAVPHLHIRHVKYKSGRDLESHPDYARRENQIFFEYPSNLPIESDELQKGLALMIENVLRFDAKKYLPGRIAELATKLGYKFQRVTIKNNKTNWGSCSSRKNINLNLHLMRLNDRLIDYVIVHELVHTVIPNHGPQFKATMKKYFTDMSELDKELKKTGAGISSLSNM